MSALVSTQRLMARQTLRQSQSLRSSQYHVWSLISSHSCSSAAVVSNNHLTFPQSCYPRNPAQPPPCYQRPHFILQTRQMAGHNKWSKIKRKKAANDKSRAALHSKAARAIEAASRACHGDLEDLHLQSAISHARSVQLSKERMERAIERGANPNMKGEGEELVVRRYDGMIPGGGNGKVAVIIETLTENRNRTAANVRHLVSKAGGELLPTGANDWMFEHVGVISVLKNGDVPVSVDGDGNNNNSTSDQIENATINEDELLECALEGGATDVEFGEEDVGAIGDDSEDEQHDLAIVKCEPVNLLGLVQTLKTGGYAIAQFENHWLVKEEGNKTLLDSEGLEKFEKFMDSMDEDLDVTHVFHNASFQE